MFKCTRQVAFFQTAVLMFWTKTNQNWNLFQNVIKQFLVFKHNKAASESRTKIKKFFKKSSQMDTNCDFLDLLHWHPTNLLVWICGFYHTLKKDHYLSMSNITVANGSKHSSQKTLYEQLTEWHYEMPWYENALLKIPYLYDKHQTRWYCLKCRNDHIEKWK